MSLVIIRGNIKTEKRNLEVSFQIEKRMIYSY